jgi:hypothetical protein
LSKLALTNRVPRQYDQASIQEIVRQLEAFANRHETEIDEAVPVLGTEVATTSGTSIDVTGIPSWAKRVTVQLVGVSTSGTSRPLFQIGDSGGIETSGYLGAGGLVQVGVSAENFTTGFGLVAGAAAHVIHGALVLTLEDSSQNTWVAAGTFALSDAAEALITAGSKSLSAALDRVRLTTLNGTDTFDAGAINILYE